MAYNGEDMYFSTSDCVISLGLCPARCVLLLGTLLLKPLPFVLQVRGVDGARGGT